MSAARRVTAIVPTTAAPQRRASLLAAVDSLRGQAGAEVRILVVANGPGIDAAVLAEVERLPGVALLRREQPGVCAARRAGRDAVDTEFFCFLDDDDVYLPGAVAARLEPLAADPGFDLAVGNGFTMAGGERRLLATAAECAAFAADPAGQLLESNWLPSCAGLFRTDAVPPELFEPTEMHHEWTLLAFRLALNNRIAFVAQPTFCVHDTPGSLSKDPEHVWCSAGAVLRMLDYDMPLALRRKVQRKLGAALHVRASRCLEQGRIAEARRWHLQSLAEPGGLARYAAFTRKLLWPRPA